MIIPIRPPSNTTLQNQCGGSIENVEWVMIELNGELLKPLDEPPGQTSSSSLKRDGADSESRQIELGSVQFDSAGVPTIIIGNHQLKGTSVTLKDPFAVLRKRKVSETQSDESSVLESKLMKRHGGAKVQYEVAGIVKKKLIFDQYPKSIMR
eukprot:CCRYP_003506-RA/>CCRYP_003506-RA protein AED:0.43 eAED:0.43 QI:141/1/1/1/1/1/2/1719/151